MIYNRYLNTYCKLYMILSTVISREVENLSLLYQVIFEFT